MALGCLLRVSIHLCKIRSVGPGSYDDGGFIVHGRSCQIQSCCFIPLAIDGSLLSFRHLSFHGLPIFVLCSTRVT